MCEACSASPPVSRRVALSAVLGIGAAAASAPAPTAASPRVTGIGAPTIAARSSWGEGLPPRGPLEVERPGDVRFLLVHHTAGSNDYGPDAVPDTIRSIYRFHTGAEKGWPDVAYNFFVDRHGGVWEGRQGSIDSPVMGSATGGSQGHALLCCFLGTHTDVAPTPAAQSSMVALLAWLAERYGIDTRPGATAEFVSRGSNLHPVGTTVRTPTIAGHRDMSSTACPGDAAYALVTGTFPALVSEHRAAATVPPTTTAAPTTAAPTTALATTVPTTTAPTTTEPRGGLDEQALDGASGEQSSAPLVAAAVGVAAAAAAAALLLKRRGLADADEPHIDEPA